MALVLAGFVSGYFGVIGLSVWGIARYDSRSFPGDQPVPTWIPWTFGWCLAVGAVLGFIGLLTSPRPVTVGASWEPRAAKFGWAVAWLIHLGAIAIVFFGAPDSNHRWGAAVIGLMPVVLVPLGRRLGLMDT